ncbi:MAG: hypothetical protein CMO01_18365 [Thalassobius sp.]|nr:hypothetical protein [Thalassovita sp.]|tara:strand:- start:141 stop:677 length:537 start_codon:yes stop_codon:yes gene_type:complete
MSERFIEMNEVEIWDEFRSGNPNALGFIYNKYANDLFNYGYRLYPNREIVKDAIQEMFLTLWKNRENLNKVKSIKNYLYFSVRRKIIRDVKNIGQYNSLDFNNDFIIPAEIKEDKYQSLLLKIDQLSSRQKEVIFLKFYNKLSNEVIAEVMEINKQSVYNLIHDALKKLKQILTVLIF